MSTIIHHHDSALWSYRSLLNNPDLSVSFDDLAFGQANLLLETDHNGVITGKLYGTGFELELNGSRQAGCPSTLWFQGKGVVDGGMPLINHLTSEQMLTQLKAFKSGAREGTIMPQLAKGYSDEQLEIIANQLGKK